MREQAAEYLSQGYKQVQVAEMLGCSVSVINELILHDEAFQTLLRDKVALVKQAKGIKALDELEEQTIKSIKQQVNEFTSLQDNLRVLETVTRVKAAQRGSQIFANNYTNPTVGITLVFNADNVPNIEYDQNNRIVKIGERSMTPMPVADVKQLFEQKRISHKGEDNDNREQGSVSTEERYGFAKSA